MFIRQDGKLYIEIGDGKIIGVNFYPDDVKKVEGTETTLKKKFEKFSATDIRIKYNIREDNPYIFPVEKKKKKEEVVEGDTTKSTKKSTRKSTRK